MKLILTQEEYHAINDVLLKIQIETGFPQYEKDEEFLKQFPKENRGTVLMSLDGQIESGCDKDLFAIDYNYSSAINSFTIELDQNVIIDAVVPVCSKYGVRLVRICKTLVGVFQTISDLFIDASDFVDSAIAKIKSDKVNISKPKSIVDAITICAEKLMHTEERITGKYIVILIAQGLDGNDLRKGDHVEVFGTDEGVIASIEESTDDCNQMITTINNVGDIILYRNSANHFTVIPGTKNELCQNAPDDNHKKAEDEGINQLYTELESCFDCNGEILHKGDHVITAHKLNDDGSLKGIITHITQLQDFEPAIDVINSKNQFIAAKSTATNFILDKNFSEKGSN